MAELTPEQIAAFERSLTPEQKADLRAKAAKAYDLQTAAGMPTTAFAERVASGATLGATDWIARHLDPKAADQMSLRQEANPKAAFAGNVTGGVGLGLATGGLAVGAAKGLGGGFLARTGVAATEGALYGLGGVVSEESLGDHELTADKLLAGARNGALIGGGLTALGLGLSKGVQEAAKRSEWLTGKLDHYANLRAVQWLKPTKRDAGSMKDMEKIGGYLHEKGVVGLSTEDAIEKLKGLRNETFEGKLAPILSMADKNGFDLGKAVQRIDDEVLAPLSKNKLDVDTYNAVKVQRDRLAAMVPEALPPPQAAQGALGAVDAPPSPALQTGFEGSEFWGAGSKPLPPPPAPTLADRGRISFKDAFDSQAKLRALAGDELYRGKYGHIKRMREIIKEEVGTQAEATLGAGIGQKFKDAMREYRYAAKPLALAESKLAGEAKGGGLLQQGDMLMGLFGASTMGPMGATLGFGRALARPHVGPLVTMGMKRAAPTIDRLAASFGRFVDSGLASGPSWGGAYRNVLSAAAGRSAGDALATHIQLAKNDPNYLATLNLGAETPAAAMGGQARIAAVEAAAEAAERVDAQVDVAINRFFGEQGGRMPKAELGVPSRRAKDFPKLFATLEAVSTRPEVLAQMLQFEHADSMPGMTAALGAKYQLAAKHLFDTAPRNPDRNPIEAMRGPWKPSDADLQKWYRRVEVVENPLRILDDVRRGTVTPEAAETFKAVYAPLFQDVQTRMMSRLASYGGGLSYKQRAALGQIFPDIGRGLAPAKAALVQGSFQAAKVAGEEQKKQGGGDAAKGKAAESRFDNLLTESQRLEKR